MSESRISGEPYVRIDRGRLANLRPLGQRSEKPAGQRSASRTSQRQASRLPHRGGQAQVSICSRLMVAKKLSATAVSQHSPAIPTDGTTPLSRVSLP